MRYYKYACIFFFIYRLHNYSAIWYDLKTMAQVWNMVWLPSPCGYTKGASKKIYDSVSAISRNSVCFTFHRI